MSDDGGNEGQTYKSKEKMARKPKKSTVVDDQFFKLSEMSKFLDQEDQRETRRQQEDDMRNAKWHSQTNIVLLLFS
jgi:U3 small nucleolar RNA-associated protein MPP10